MAFPGERAFIPKLSIVGKVRQIGAGPQNNRVPAEVVPDEVPLAEVEVEDGALPLAVPRAGVDAD